MEPITDVRDISRIAYGFMASKVLFASLNLDIYSRLSGHPKTLQQLSRETGIVPSRLLTLLTACVGLGLLTINGETYADSPASETYLVRSSKGYFGDYFRFQIDRHVYPHLEQIDAALRGEATQSFYDLLEDQEEAEHFSRAQHVGSLGPATTLAKVVDLSDCRTLLDIAGGSGAFSITLCGRYPQMRATIIDFPKVIDVAKKFVSESGLIRQIDFISGDALEVEWPENQDAILMSYLLSAVSEEAIGELIRKAHHVLSPGGLLMIHDFMLDDDRTGPTYAALWFTVFISNPEAISFTSTWLTEVTVEKGFGEIEVGDLIPGFTKLLAVRKPI